jgi:NAD(P)-dependent dehydrogenase (short-subunit alcohol dehydrogenase family)
MSRPIAIVTGGSRGIGLATVERLLAGGSRVAFCGRDARAGEQAIAQVVKPRDAVFVRCDVALEDEVRGLVAACVERFGPPTLLVNNAGINASFDAVSMTEGQWDAFFAVDLKAAWLCAKHALPHLLEAQGGAIVNVSSIHAVVTRDSFFPYAAAKSALVGLTRSLALDYGPYGVRVNCVCPGFTRTRLVEESMALADDPSAAEAAMVAGVALGRIADPSEIASAIAFLASPEAGYITGTTLFVDGGLTARRAG